MSETTKTYSYEEAYATSLDYFGQDGELGAKIVCDKYLLRDNEGNFVEKNPDDLHRRLARELARVEAKKFKKPFTEDEIFEFLREFRRIIPQGGPLFGIGNPYQYVTVGNCYVLPPIHDSYPGIHYTDTCITEISKRRGGVGFDISTLRPAGSPTKNSSRTSTGIIPFMERFSNTIREVGQAGRRGASLQTISVHHPQVCDFATVKRDLKKVTGANISVKLSDEFMQAVFDDTDYEQRFPVDSKSPIISRRVRARDVWNVIVENAWFMAEPGLVFWDSHTKDSPADCYAPQFSSVTGNPCTVAETWVNTTDGPRRVISLVGKKFIGIINGEEFESSENGFWHSGTKEVFRIETERGYSVILTADHLLLSNDKWIPVSLLSPGDSLDLSNHRSASSWNGNGTEDEGWLLGNLVGDGCHTPYQGVLDYWGKTKDFMHAYAVGCLKRAVKCRSDVGNADKNGENYTKRDRIRTSSTGLLGLVKKFDLLEKRIGVNVEEASSDFYRGFLRGWFDADGTVHPDKEKGDYVRLGSVIPENLYAAQRMLARFGIMSTVYRERKKPGRYLLPDGKGGEKEYECKECCDLHISKDNLVRFAAEIGFIEPEKSEKLSSVLKSYTKGPYREKFKTKIKSIESLGQRDVFDCSINFAKEYCANGFRSHNCSEILMSDDSCRLFVINALTYVNNPFSADAEFDWPRFKADCKIMQRLMDDVVDLEIECIDRIIKKIEDDPEPDHIKRIPREMWTRYRQNAINGRRTGSGQTALGDAIAALGIGYGIDESIQFVDDFYRTLKEGCYESSVEMAEELGPFPLYDASKEVACPYILRLKEQFPALWERMQKSGRRNIALLTTAPAGTISNLAFAGEVNGKKFFGTSSGIEPVFQLSYIRRKKINHDDKEAKVDFVDQSGDKWQNFTVVHPPAQYWSELTGEKDLSKSPWFGFCAEEIDWLQRVKLQGIATKHLCHAVSSTINLPEDVTKEKVAEIYETAYKMGCKGITCYRKNCRSGVLIDVESSTKPSKIKKTKAPKRPRSLPCEVHHLSVKGTKYGVIVGLLDGDPYEVLVSSKPIPASVIKGNLVRVKRGEYNLVYASKLNGETKSLDGVSHCDAEEEALLRMTSTALRHGADIAFVVQQLEKTKGEMHSFAKSVARTLKKYVPDGTKVSGESCPDCGGSDLRRQEGCVTCSSCSWSKCS